jgi:hypothetical protein
MRLRTSRAAEHGWFRYAFAAVLCAACGTGEPPPVEPHETPPENVEPSEPSPEPSGACGGASCAEGELCCTTSCEGAQTCAPREQACPQLECASCPEGTCRRAEGEPCATPSGPLGNACCGCGPDGMCSSLCRCAALDTPIETPDGARPIASLRSGDLVISIDQGRRIAVPIARVHRARAVNHRVVRLELGNGQTLRMSPGHPTADGRTFADLRAGDRIDDVRILAATIEPYDQSETADILPASDSGTYVAAGVLVGSTLAGADPRVSSR